MRAVHRFVPPSEYLPGSGTEAGDLSLTADQLPVDTPFRVTHTTTMVKLDALTNEPVLVFIHLLDGMGG